jgi:hypothetical protein
MTAHVLQECKQYKAQGLAIWSDGQDLKKELWGMKKNLKNTAAFVTDTGLPRSKAEDVQPKTASLH